MLLLISVIVILVIIGMSLSVGEPDNKPSQTHVINHILETYRGQKHLYDIKAIEFDENSVELLQLIKAAKEYELLKNE